jgi:hypothetical protein
LNITSININSSKKICTFKINKKSIDQIILFFSLLFFSPFVIGPLISPSIIRHIIVVIFLIYFLYRSDCIVSRTQIFFYCGIFFLLVFYFFYYINAGTGDVKQIYDFFLKALFVLSLVIYLLSGDNLVLIIKPFISIVLVISCLTSISCIVSNAHLLPFRSATILGYAVGFNYLFGMVHPSFISYFRPSFYFAEPSYLGFFLGFAFFYISKAYWLKNRKLLVSIIFVSGILTGSFTFYVAFTISFCAKFINEKFLYKFKEKLSIFYFVAFLLLSIYQISDIANFQNSVMSNFKTSLDSRKFRMYLSVKTLKKESTTEIFMGLGPGSILKSNRKIGESNAFVKMLIEEGLIITVFILILIYYHLRNNTALLLFCLLTFNSVIILDTPLLIFLLLISTIFNNMDKDTEKYTSILKSS